MADRRTDILAEVADYYSAKLAEHGESPRGVDWNGEASQFERFEQLVKIVREREGFSINDIGCGYGALLDYLTARNSDFIYTGCDIASDMVRAARARYRGRLEARFEIASEPQEPSDYSVASGIFNVRLSRSNTEWRKFIEAAIDILDRKSRKGFAFNCLTSYADSEKMQDYLYYADPCVLFDFCKHRYSHNVALLHDYDLYEFTILVRKER